MMNQTRAYGPKGEQACVACDMLEGNNDPATIWASAFVLGAAGDGRRPEWGGGATPFFFCARHASIVASALALAGVPPEKYIRLNLAAARSVS